MVVVVLVLSSHTSQPLLLPFAHPTPRRLNPQTSTQSDAPVCVQVPLKGAAVTDTFVRASREPDVTALSTLSAHELVIRNHRWGVVLDDWYQHVSYAARLDFYEFASRCIRSTPCKLDLPHCDASQPLRPTALFPVLELVWPCSREVSPHLAQSC